MPASTRVLHSARGEGGVFATRDIQPGAWLVAYGGTVRTFNGLEHLESSKLLAKQWHAAHGQGVVRIVDYDTNTILVQDGSTHGPEEADHGFMVNSSAPGNAEFVIRPIKDEVWIRATERIPEGGEVCVNYGMAAFGDPDTPLTATERAALDAVLHPPAPAHGRSAGPATWLAGSLMRKKVD